MHHILTRRGVLGLGSGFAAASLFTDAGAAGARAVFIAQSGAAPETYCMGAIAASNLEIEKAGIARLRADLKYARVLRAKSTDRRKTEFGQGLIDRLVDGQGLAFYAIIARAGIGAGEPSVRRQLLQAANVAAGPVFMTAQSPRAASKRSVKIAHSIRSALPLSGAVQLRHPKDEDLLQMAGFLAALVRLDQVGAAGSANAALLDYLKRKLRVARLDETSLKDYPKFRVVAFKT